MIITALENGADLYANHCMVLKGMGPYKGLNICQARCMSCIDQNIAASGSELAGELNLPNIYY